MAKACKAKCGSKKTCTGTPCKRCVTPGQASCHLHGAEKPPCNRSRKMPYASPSTRGQAKARAIARVRKLMAMGI